MTHHMTHQLTRIAATLAKSSSPHTKSDLRDALRSAGLPIGKNVEPLQARLTEMHTARAYASSNRIARRLGHPVNYFMPPPARQIVMYHGTPAERLLAKRQRAVRETAYSLFRHGAAGGGSIEVELTNNPSHVWYKVVMGTITGVYKGRYNKGYTATTDNHRITVPVDWLIRVAGRGLASVDGLMTLDASPLMSPPGVDLFAAIWATQGRGYSVNTFRGIIARSGDVHYHGDDISDAMAGLGKKLRSVKKATLMSEILTESIERFVDRYSGTDTVVRVSDATTTGSCEYGIRSWCHSTGLDYEHGSAPMSAVLTAFRSHPRREARLAIMHAARTLHGR